MDMNQNDLTGWVGHNLLDQRGDRIGKITDLYMDEDTGQPEWVAVNTGRFGSRISFAPLAGARASADDLQVPYTEDQVKDAPQAEPDGRLSQEEEARLYAHYGFDYSQNRSPSGLPETGGRGGQGRGRAAKGRDTSGRTTDDAMTRSEEELDVGKRSREAGRARLRKYVVTEQETVTVPVSREEVRVEREPITDANVGKAMEGPDISEEEHEVVLHEEEPVVSKKAVPKERVRLDTETVTDQRRVSDEVRKERIETEGDVPGQDL